MKSTKRLAFSVAAAAGLVGGWLLARQHLERHKADLFSVRPLRRWVALSYLAGRPGPATLQLLSDYIRWEPSPTLKRRASRLLRRMKLSLA